MFLFSSQNGLKRKHVGIKCNLRNAEGEEITFKKINLTVYNCWNDRQNDKRENIELQICCPFWRLKQRRNSQIDFYLTPSIRE